MNVKWRVDEIVGSMVRSFESAADLSGIALAYAERAEARALLAVGSLAKLDGRSCSVPVDGDDVAAWRSVRVSDTVWDSALFHSREACAYLEAALVFEAAPAYL